MYLNGIKNNIENAIDFFQLVGIRVAHFVIVCESLYQHKTMIKFFKDVCDFDLAMKQVNIENSLRKFRNKNLLVLIVEVIFYFGMPLMALVLLLLRKDYGMITYWVSYFLPLLVCCFRYVQACNCVWFIKQRFEILNERLSKIDLLDEHDEKLNLITSIDFKLYIKEMKRFKRPKLLKNFEQLILMRQLYDKLYNLSLDVNYSFGISNLVNIANDFVSLTSNSYFIFLSLQSSPYDTIFHILQTIFWCLPHLVNIVSISAVCHFTVHAVSKLNYKLFVK
jgi:7tm Chemosensory receptor